MSRYLTVLLSVIVLAFIVSYPTAHSTVQPELTKKEKRTVKRIAKKQAKKQAKKKIDAILPIETPNLATEAVTTPKIESGAVGTDEIADGAVTEAKLSDALRGERKFYLTKEFFAANNALNACADDFHMASMFEVLDLSNLQYDEARGFSWLDGDQGDGPPSNRSGWIRTGGPKSTDASFNAPGIVNCAAWTQNSSAPSRGTGAYLDYDWTNSGTPSVNPWNSATFSCNSATLHVWCIQDR